MKTAQMKTVRSVAEVFQTYGKDFLKSNATKLPAYKKTALWCLANCQTPSMGGRTVVCKECGVQKSYYNSCRHRGCPQCEGMKEAAWLLKRQEELLPTHYFHIVFTLPHIFNDLILHNQKRCFSIFFSSVAKAMMTVAENRLQAKLGFFSILHTWGQKLDFHPHIHCVVPGGGIAKDGKWISTSKKQKYFAPTKVLSEVFRGIFIKELKKAVSAHQIVFNGDIEALCTESVKKQWVVHAQPPFGSPIAVLKYLSRYTRKVALSNARLISIKDNSVTFSFKDYSDYSAQKQCSLHPNEFIRRFLLHIPPTGFVRIRYFGFMAGKGRKARISAISELIFGLLPKCTQLDVNQNSGLSNTGSSTTSSPNTCHCCGAVNAFILVAEFKKNTNLNFNTS